MISAVETQPLNKEQHEEVSSQKPMKEKTPYDWHIEPTNSLLDLKLKDVWQYRDLLWLFVRRDFVSVYKQTILGPLWFFIQPLLTTIMFTLVFGNLAGISTDGLPKPLFYLAGITAWNYFADCLSKTSSVFRDNASIFGKVYFPRLIMPLSIVFSNLIRFGVQLLLFLVMIVYYKANGFNFHATNALLLFPVLIILMAALGLGTGMIISAMTTKYRDLAFLITFGIQLLMYATTVIYPLSAVPEKYRLIIEYNPLTPIIETFRYGFLGEGEFSFSYLLYATAVTVVLLLIGIVTFNRVEKNFVDTV
jgi:lipopolysaccharide transport system permease protein